jgi:hypothetical protein
MSLHCFRVTLQAFMDTLHFSIYGSRTNRNASGGLSWLLETLKAPHCKKSWWKTPPAWPDVTDSLVRGMENFFDMKIKLIWRAPTTKTEYFEIIGISQRFFVLTRRSFLTIFRQLPTNESISKAAPPGFDPTTFRVTIYYSTTAPHSLYVNLCDSTLFPLLSTCLPSSVLCFFINTELDF